MIGGSSLVSNAANPVGSLFNESISNAFANVLSGVDLQNGFDMDTFNLASPGAIEVKIRANFVDVGGLKMAEANLGTSASTVRDRVLRALVEHAPLPRQPCKPMPRPSWLAWEEEEAAQRSMRANWPR